MHHGKCWLVKLLDQTQLRHLDEEGWCLVGPLLTEAELSGLRQEEARFRSIMPHEPHETVFRSQLAPYSEVVREFVNKGSATAVAQQVLGQNVAHWFNQYVTKLPDSGSGKSHFPWHQDNGYTAISPATNITIWIALDDVDQRNGCVWIVPKSHERGLLPHGMAGPDNWYLQVDVETDGIPAEMKAGEAVVFHGLTLHRSLLNHSDQPRRAFFVEYADANARYTHEGSTKPIILNPHTSIVAGEVPWSSDRVRVQ
jgi:ectoine hydroxylase-related dioxygenase (phytanoyl-CoA dioxygenase family)